MSQLLRTPLVFIVGYVILMIPTYLLPWLGSNSAVVNALGAAVGWGMTPQWWAHVWCLGMLILLAHLRGGVIGKNFLVAFPALAAAFDLTPILSMIPLVPTILHLLALILGATTASRAPSEDAGGVDKLPATTRKAGILAGGMTFAAIAGSLLFVSTVTRGVSNVSENKTNVTAPAAQVSLPASAPSRSTPVAATASVSANPELPSIQVTQNVSAARVASAPSARVAKKAIDSKPKDNGEHPLVRYININDK